MSFTRHLPRASLQGLVDSLWCLEAAADAPMQSVLPDGCPEWVFQLASPYAQLQPDGSWLPQGQRLLVGQQLQPVALRPLGPVRCLGVHFEPAGLAAWMGGDLRRFTGRIEDLDWALGLDLRGLSQTLAAMPQPQALEALQDWLETLPRRPPDPRLTQAVQALSGRPLAELPALAAELGWSERQLRRRFEAAVGLGPKRFQRLVRFQRVFAQAREHEAQAWVEAALDGGYCDQAHFSREVRTFCGASPRELLRELSPLTAHFLSLSDFSKTAAAARR
ncbi:MAG: AraC family transcriptional regulator [Inhella sp.]